MEITPKSGLGTIQTRAWKPLGCVGRRSIQTKVCISHRNIHVQFREREVMETGGVGRSRVRSQRQVTGEWYPFAFKAGKHNSPKTVARYQ